MSIHVYECDIDFFDLMIYVDITNFFANLAAFWIFSVFLLYPHFGRIHSHHKSPGNNDSITITDWHAEEEK